MVNLRLTEEKLRQEVLDLRRPWYQKNFGPIANIAIAVTAGLLAFGTDVFKSNISALLSERKQLARSVADLRFGKTNLSAENAKLSTENVIASAKVSELDNEATALQTELASRELASKAEEQLPNNTTAAQKLAIEAWRRKHTKDARKAIVDAYSNPILELEGRATGMFSPDSQRVVIPSVGDNGPPEVWDATTGKLLTKLEGGTGVVAPSYCCAIAGSVFSPDGQRVVIGSVDSPADVRDATTGKLLVTLILPKKPKLFNVTGIVFSPNGKSVLIVRHGGFGGGSRDFDVAIYKLVTPEDVEKLFR